MPSVERGQPLAAAGCVPVERVDDALQAVDVFGELAGELDAVAADVVEGQRRSSIQACESSDIATPASTRSMPNRQVLWTKSTP